MILISQDKKTVLFLKEVEMLKIYPENTIHSTDDIKCVYVVKLYPKLKDYFDSKLNKANYCIEMARYNTEEHAISAIEKVNKYRYSDSVYTFSSDASLKKEKAAQ